jgi:DNA-binding CsgD family transcriptional regulator
MNVKAFSRIHQGLDLFRKIISPLKQSFDMSFGYMVVFKDDSYYTIVEDRQCLNEFVTFVKESHIFCDNNVHAFFDGEYYFTLWPETPTCKAMEVYFNNNQWNGITISKVTDNFIELWWFSGDKNRSNLQHFLSCNKNLLLKFIHYFNSFKQDLYIPSSGDLIKNLFKFEEGFQINLSSRQSLDEACKIIKFLNDLKFAKLKPEGNLSPREIEVLLILRQGFTSKFIAKKLALSPKTVENHIEHIKIKTQIRFKSDLIEYSKSLFES